MQVTTLLNPGEHAFFLHSDQIREKPVLSIDVHITAEEVRVFYTFRSGFDADEAPHLITVLEEPRVARTKAELLSKL
jgi:hypothetical protein